MLLYGTVAALISSKREAIKLSLEHSFKPATHHMPPVPKKDFVSRFYGSARESNSLNISTTFRPGRVKYVR